MATQPSDHDMLRELWDRAQLTDVIGRYCYGMDSRDWKMYRDCWADEMDVSQLFDLGAEHADRPVWIKTDDWVAALQQFFSDMPHSQHLKTPISFEIEDDRATVRSILQGKHFQPTTEGADQISTVIGYYIDQFVRTPDGWRMLSFKEIRYWQEGNPHIQDSGHDHLFNALAKRYPELDWTGGRKALLQGIVRDVGCGVRTSRTSS